MKKSVYWVKLDVNDFYSYILSMEKGEMGPWLESFAKALFIKDQKHQQAGPLIIEALASHQKSVEKGKKGAKVRKDSSSTSSPASSTTISPTSTCASVGLVVGGIASNNNNNNNRTNTTTIEKNQENQKTPTKVATLWPYPINRDFYERTIEDILDEHESKEWAPFIAWKHPDVFGKEFLEQLQKDGWRDKSGKEIEKKALYFSTALKNIVHQEYIKP